MRTLANLSIRDKLVGIILIATILSIAAGFGLVIHNNIKTFEEDLVDSVQTIADVVSPNVGLMVFMEDEPSAWLELDKVKPLAWISEAHFYDTEKQIYASYVRLGSSQDPAPDLDPEQREELELQRMREQNLRVAFAPENIPVEDASVVTDTAVEVFKLVEYTDPESGEVIPVGTFFLRGSKESYRQKVQELITYMLVLGLAVVAAAAVLAYALQGVISKPILYLAEMAKRISEESDYSVRVPKPGNDEIGILYDGFNNMLEQIQQRQEDLERSNRDLDQFAYVASHDLKAPLRAIATLSGWIEEDLDGKLSPEATEQMQLLRSRVQRMDKLIEGILQYSRAGRMDTRGEKTDIGVMVRELVELLSPPETFEIQVEPEMPTLVTRRLRLEQVFSNLINNAIKYHDRPDGKVEVAARRVGEFYEFSVSDDGPGIAEEHHEKVFMMFQTLHPRDQFESTGLGLSLVKKLVEEEGGSIHLESKSGQGACFRFTWPANNEGESLEDTQP